jgi:hypothetical protein
MLCGVSRTGVDFEYSFADVRGEAVKDPSSETWSTAETLSGDDQILIGGTSIEKAELENEPESLDAVSPADALALGIRPAVIADRYLVDSGAPLGEPSGHLRFESESITGQTKTL